MKFKHFSHNKNFTEKKNLLVIFILLFLILIIFNKFSITGDTQFRLECIKLLSLTGTSCIEQIYYHFNFHVFVLFFIKIAESISFLFPSFNTSTENIQKIYFEAFLSLVFYFFFYFKYCFAYFLFSKKWQ